MKTAIPYELVRNTHVTHPTLYTLKFFVKSLFG